MSVSLIDIAKEERTSVESDKYTKKHSISRSAETMAKVEKVLGGSRPCQAILIQVEGIRQIVAKFT